MPSLLDMEVIQQAMVVNQVDAANSSDVTERINSTGGFNSSDRSFDSRAFGCSLGEWATPNHFLFQLANLGLLIAFALPISCNNSTALHGILALAFLVSTTWSWIVLCSADVFSWNFAFMLVNLLQMLASLYQARQVRLPVELDVVYNALFLPLNVPRECFKKLVHTDNATVLTMHAGEPYATQFVTKANRLSLLLAGSCRVMYNNHYLHLIQPNQFLDSPEFETTVFGKEKFQVSIVAAERCRYLCWRRDDFDYLMIKDAYLNTIMAGLLAADIVDKLCALSQQVNCRPLGTLASGAADSVGDDNDQRDSGCDEHHEGNEGENVDKKSAAVGVVDRRADPDVDADQTCVAADVRAPLSCVRSFGKQLGKQTLVNVNKHASNSRASSPSAHSASSVLLAITPATPNTTLTATTVAASAFTPLESECKSDAVTANAARPQSLNNDLRIPGLLRLLSGNEQLRPFFIEQKYFFRLFEHNNHHQQRRRRHRHRHDRLLSCDQSDQHYFVAQPKAERLPDDVEDDHDDNEDNHNDNGDGDEYDDGSGDSDDGHSYTHGIGQHRGLALHYTMDCDSRPLDIAASNSFDSVQSGSIEGTHSLGKPSKVEVERSRQQQSVMLDTYNLNNDLSKRASAYCSDLSANRGKSDGLANWGAHCECQFVTRYDHLRDCDADSGAPTFDLSSAKTNAADLKAIESTDSIMPSANQNRSTLTSPTLLFDYVSTFGVALQPGRLDRSHQSSATCDQLVDPAVLTTLVLQASPS